MTQDIAQGQAKIDSQDINDRQAIELRPQEDLPAKHTRHRHHHQILDSGGKFSTLKSFPGVRLQACSRAEKERRRSMLIIV